MENYICQKFCKPLLCDYFLMKATLLQGQQPFSIHRTKMKEFEVAYHAEMWHQVKVSNFSRAL